ncbi:MAG TPA: NF041680 family putative transposase [Streptosporangiaceae bacterium]|nr:NF041680 family putative transposase [Streptosporangiaceae bacterium]
MKAVAVAFSIAWRGADVEPAGGAVAGTREALERLGTFRGELYKCLTKRADALFELAEATLCADGPVRTLAGLSLAPEHRRGHGALYDAVNAGRIEIGRLRRAVAGLPLPRAADDRLMLAVDVSNWLRPDAATSPERLFCHTYGRGKGQAQMIPGWPYSVVAALEPGRTSWTAVLDAVRLGPADNETDVTAAQVREVVTRLIAAGQHKEGDPDILVVFDAGYDVTRLAFLLTDLPVELLGRLRSDRVLYFPAAPRAPGANGRPSRHGHELKLAEPGTWPDPPVTTVTQTTRYGTAVAQSWDRLHPRLTSRAAWQDHDGELPVIDGTLIRLQVDHLPGDRDPKPVWLWWSATGATPADVDRCWQAFLRRFDIEHTFRLFKQVLGWTAPKICDPAAADRWTWLIIACHAQLRLARPLAADLRRPWERPAPPGRLTPARVRRGFRNIRAKITCPAGAPKPRKPGPGRPPGSKNRRPAARHDVGKHRKASMADKKTG